MKVSWGAVTIAAILAVYLMYLLGKQGYREKAKADLLDCDQGNRAACVRVIENSQADEASKAIARRKLVYPQ